MWSIYSIVLFILETFTRYQRYQRKTHIKALKAPNIHHVIAAFGDHAHHFYSFLWKNMREKKLKTTCILDKVTKNINLVMILSQHSLENTTDYYCFISFVLKPGLFLDCTSSSVASTPAFLEILRRSCEEVNRGKERNLDCVDHTLCCTEKDLPSVVVGTSLCAGQVWWVSQWAAVCVPVAASGPEEK